MLTEEQTSQIKQQIIQQIESTFPEDKKELAKQQIISMNAEQLEAFLKQNKILKDNTQCVFCSIISGDIGSYQIDKNESAIAVLEINPISRGHVLIIPKKHMLFDKKVPLDISSLAKKISKKIKTKLKPKEIKILPSNLFGHGIVNLLPIYKNETLDSERRKASPDELEELQRLFKEKKTIIKKPKTKKINEKLWLPKRIP
ncbi:hypothetical protein DRN69_04110 [Candidatus Pacearchaeota archaeon]|nr:MAG: hypothetical protein DRN69_04110 [Candidatus Pacearchaeota archaeon]